VVLELNTAACAALADAFNASQELSELAECAP
jgi:hypothetical protein